MQSWLGESEDSKKSTSTPGYFSVGMSRMFFMLEATSTLRQLTRDNHIVMALIVTYLPIFLPPAPGQKGSPTGAPAPAPA